MADTNSTMGRRIIIQIGAPIGNMCAKNPLKSVRIAHKKIGDQKERLTDITTL